MTLTLTVRRWSLWGFSGLAVLTFAATVLGVLSNVLSVFLPTPLVHPFLLYNGMVSAVTFGMVAASISPDERGDAA